jgi:hypothetical protein
MDSRGTWGWIRHSPGGTIWPMPEEFAVKARPAIEQVLQPGEQLFGIAAATHAKTFSGQLYAVGTTDRRLILQPLDRHIQPKGAPLLLAPEAIESARIDGAGGGWVTAPNAILDVAAVTLELRIRGGDKLKLMMMNGGGGILGSLGGGQSQQQGVLGVAEFVRRHFPPG